MGRRTRKRTARSGSRTAEAKRARQSPRDTSRTSCASRRERPVGGASSPRQREHVDTSESLFKGLDEDCRLKIFGFLTWEELADASPVCRQFRDDCRHPTLPLLGNRAFVLHARGRVSVLFRRVVELAERGTLNSFSRLKVIQDSELDRTAHANAERIRGSCTLPEITSLEVSYRESDRHDARKGRWYTDLLACWMWRDLAGFFPNLRHLTITDPRVPSDCPEDILRHCSWVESFTWHGKQWSPFLEGRGMYVRGYLREIYMDDTIFSTNLSFNAESFFHSPDPGTGCIMWGLIEGRGWLERLSIKNGRYRTCRSLEEPQVLEIPQAGLIKFVRRAERLKWFRSDLTTENVAMLQLERPDVTFAS